SKRDWSSDVCSSDLRPLPLAAERQLRVVVFHINSRPSQHQPASVHATHLSCLRGHQALPVVCGKQTGSRLYPRRVTRRHNLVQLDSFFPVRWLHLCACVFSSSSFLPLSFYS